MFDADTGPFWMVYGMNQSAPVARHKTFESAANESKRLARSNPGVEFYVLATVARAVKADVDFRRIDTDEIPF